MIWGGLLAEKLVNPWKLKGRKNWSFGEWGTQSAVELTLPFLQVDVFLEEFVDFKEITVDDQLVPQAHFQPWPFIDQDGSERVLLLHGFEVDEVRQDAEVLLLEKEKGKLDLFGD